MHDTRCTKIFVRNAFLKRILIWGRNEVGLVNNQSQRTMFYLTRFFNFTFVLSILSTLCFSSAAVLAQPAPDKVISTSSPNPVGSGARAIGMGGAFIAVADDATAASWNPAGLTQLKKPEISFALSYFRRRDDFSSSQHQKYPCMPVLRSGYN